MANSEAKWVPAGLYYGANGWESLNIVDICNYYRNAALNIGIYPEEYAFFAKEEHRKLKAIGYNNDYKFLSTEYFIEGYETIDDIKEL